MLQFLLRQDYFGKVWLTLTQYVKEKILDILSDRKGMVLYEKSN